MCPKCGKSYSEEKMCNDCNCELVEKTTEVTNEKKTDKERVEDFYEKFFKSDLKDEFDAANRKYKKRMNRTLGFNAFYGFMFLSLSISFYGVLFLFARTWNYQYILVIPGVLLITFICKIIQNKNDAALNKYFEIFKSVEDRYKAEYAAFKNPPIKYGEDGLDEEYFMAIYGKFKAGLATTVKEAKQLVDEDKKHEEMLSGLANIAAAVASSGQAVQNAVNKNTRAVNRVNRTIRYK